MNNRLKEAFNNLQKSIEISDKDENVLIIDGLNSFLRVFSAVPVLNDNGEHIGGVIGFLKSISSNIRQFSATRCILVFDGKNGSSRRRKIYPEYKGQRKPKQTLNRFESLDIAEPEDVSLKRQWNLLVQFLDILPLTIISIDNIEADDTISYLCNQYYENSNNNITIVSSDRDFLQLVTDRIKVWSPIKKKLYTPELIRSEFNIHERNYLLYRVLTGDDSDNIPGVKGVGLKTLIKIFPDLISLPVTKDNLYSNINIKLDEKKPAQVVKTLNESKDIIELNYKLMQLTEVDISGQAKLRINDLMKLPIPNLNISKFKYLVVLNKLTDSFKNIDEWLRDTFIKLTVYK